MELIQNCAESQKHLARALLDAGDAGDHQRWGEFFAEEAEAELMLLHIADTKKKSKTLRFVGRDAIIESQKTYLRAFKLTNLISDIICEENFVSVRFIQQTKNKDMFMECPPTFLTGNSPKVILLRFDEDGLVRRLSWYFDSGILRHFTQPSQERDEDLPSDVLKQQSRRALEVGQTGNGHAFAACFSRDGCLINATFKPTEVWRGTDALVENIKWWTTAFNMKADVQFQICEGSTVVNYGVLHLKHIGDFEGIAATDKMVDLPFAMTSKFKKGTSMIELWECMTDYEGLAHCLKE